MKVNKTCEIPSDPFVFDPRVLYVYPDVWEYMCSDEWENEFKTLRCNSKFRNPVARAMPICLGHSPNRLFKSLPEAQASIDESLFHLVDALNLNPQFQSITLYVTQAPPDIQEYLENRLSRLQLAPHQPIERPVFRELKAASKGLAIVTRSSDAGEVFSIYQPLYLGALVNTQRMGYYGDPLYYETFKRPDGTLIRVRYSWSGITAFMIQDDNHWT